VNLSTARAGVHCTGTVIDCDSISREPELNPETTDIMTNSFFFSGRYTRRRGKYLDLNRDQLTKE
jgi:hypothetical protein